MVEQMVDLDEAQAKREHVWAEQLKPRGQGICTCGHIQLFHDRFCYGNPEDEPDSCVCRQFVAGVVC